MNTCGTIFILVCLTMTMRLRKNPGPRQLNWKRKFGTTPGKQELVHNPRVPNWGRFSDQCFNEESDKKFNAFAGYGFLVFGVVTVTGNGTTLVREGLHLKLRF